jgi:alpha-galactosidase
VQLKVSFYPVTVSLFYTAYRKENIIQQWMEVKHQEKGAVTLYDFASADLSFHAPAYYLTYYYGDWANEFNLVEDALKEGTKVIDSKFGVRANQKSSPSFLLSLNNNLQEDRGEVIGGTLAWPGNWQLRFDLDHTKNLKVFSGMNPYGSQYALAANTVFTTPAFLHTYTNEGAGEVSRRFHRWARTYGIADGYKSRDILLNNWEATYFDFDEPKLTNIIKEAGKMGFELFLLDDGWFGNKYPRNNDNAGLGDWQVNTKKLPNGIGYLVETCKENKLKFGIWIEPEMVNPKSELYEKHPDWVIGAANRSLDLQRNQLILDLSNPQVQEYVYQSLEQLVSANKGISYLKWDCNRYVTNAGSQYLGKDKQTHLFIEYPRALLKIMDRFRKKFPQITMMVCAGGGGRMDYATMPYFQEFWPSDNTDAVDRIKIQWGLEYFFPAIGLASHVSVTPNHITGRTTPLKFRFDVAMAGKLGMDLQPMQMTAEEKEFSKNAIQTYKEVRAIVLHGDLYRLLSPYTGDRVAQQYVSEDQRQALVFNYLLKKCIYADKTVLRLKGLKPAAQYKLTEINKGTFSRLGDYEGKTFSGAFLMTSGLQFDMYNEYESNVFLLSEQQ